MDNDLATRHPLAPWLRQRVLALRAATARRIFPPVIELVLARPAVDDPPLARWEHTPKPIDHALRVDILVRLLTGCTRPLALVHIRPGHHDVTDADVAWSVAGRTAGAIVGCDVTTTIALSRWGWRDLGSGAAKTWKRPRAIVTGSARTTRRPPAELRR